MTYPPPPNPDEPQDPNVQPGGYAPPPPMYPQGGPQQGYPPPSYPPPPYPQQGYPQPGYPQPGYPQQAYGAPGSMPPPPPGAVYSPYGNTGFDYGRPVPGGRIAGMGARFGGLVLDSVILGIVNLVVTALTGGFHTTTTENCDSSGLCTSSNNVHFDGWGLLITVLIGFAYFGYMVGIRTQTLGHMAAGIRVVDLATGQPIGAGRAILRWFVLALTGALCTLGYWSPFFDSTRRQGWHDKASKAVVIPAQGR